MGWWAIICDSMPYQTRRKLHLPFHHPRPGGYPLVARPQFMAQSYRLRGVNHPPQRRRIVSIPQAQARNSPSTWYVINKSWFHQIIHIHNNILLINFFLNSNDGNQVNGGMRTPLMLCEKLQEQELPLMFRMLTPSTVNLVIYTIALPKVGCPIQNVKKISTK